MIKNQPRGSEWRRWDLHVHTPFSALNNGFGSDFESYAKTLLKKAVDVGVVVIGVTDYFGINGYKKLRLLVRDKTKLIELLGDEYAEKAFHIALVPNIELRSSVLVNDSKGKAGRVNFHIIFSDALDPEVIEENFLRELKFTAASSPSCEDERWSVTTGNLESLGRRLKAEQASFSTSTDLCVGMMNAVISHEEVTRVLVEQKSRFSGKYLFVVDADEDLSKLDWKGQGHQTRKLFIQKADMLFSGSPGTRSFALGEKHASSQAYLSEFKSFKPCVHGSDAHNFDSLFEPAKGRHLWVKADPTFNGLLQLLHEPAERIFIGEKPELLASISNRASKIVESLVVKKRSQSHLSEVWFDCCVPLNPELVSVIGNKGSGKSALADILGLMGNASNHENFSFLNPSRFRDRNNKAQHFDATLVWVDGTSEGPRQLTQNPSSESVEKIKYIPQSYLDDICNEVNGGAGSRFYKELQEVIFSHVIESERLGFGSLDALLAHRGLETKNTIEILKSELKNINRKIVELERRQLPIHRKTLESQLAEKVREHAALVAARPVEVPKPEHDPLLQNQSKQASEKIEQLQRLLEDLFSLAEKNGERLRQIALLKSSAERVLGRLENIYKQVNSALDGIDSDIKELEVDREKLISLTVNTRLVEGLILAYSEEKLKLEREMSSDVEGSLANVRDKTSQEIYSLQARLSEPALKYQSYLRSLKDWDDGCKRLQGTVESVGSITYLKNEINKLCDLPVILLKCYAERRRKVLEIFGRKKKLQAYFESYYGSVQKFLAEHPIAKKNNFKLNFSVAMTQSKLASLFLAKIHKGRIGFFAGTEDGAAALRKIMEPVDWNCARKVLRFTERIMYELRNHNSQLVDVANQLVSGQTVDELYDFVFSLDYISPIYRLAWDGKALEQLSPGERGNLLLIFYLLVDRSNIPLVIDQPEENLDNQTVVKVLVPCVKEAKKRRQIIMVTHNPNLAIVCDSEQIIYAEMRKDMSNAITYFGGSIENPLINEKILDVLEGTRPAFDMRDAKYMSSAPRVGG